jgi:two-component system sensor kinase
MSHEIRTPLNAVLGYAEILRGDVDAPDPALDRRAVTETICSAGHHLLSLIEDILDLSKIEADKMTTERIAVDVTEVLRDIERMLEAKAVARGLQLKFSVAGGLPPRIVGDPTRLRQILMNLAGNALKFTETGGVTIHVEAVDAEAGRRLKIEVTDTGAGMTDVEAALLVRPFTQADVSVTRKFGGTGPG